FGEEVIQVLKDDYQHHVSTELKVSVIVPNYNHGHYLEERFRSIFDQTHRPHEIFFLDDASTDDSIAVARRMASGSPIPFHVIQNEGGTRGTFRQWLRGLGLATGDLIWIAEADDACRPEFVERLVPEFFDPEVVLAYSQSAVIGPRGELEHP